MNLSKELKNVKGQTYPMTFISPDDLEAIKSERNIETVLMTDMPKETVRNVILNCLANFVIDDKKETFLVHKAADWVLADKTEEDEMPEKVFDFITKKVLPKSVYRVEDVDGKKVEKGVYTAWTISQVLLEFGIEE